MRPGTEGGHAIWLTVPATATAGRSGTGDSAMSEPSDCNAPKVRLVGMRRAGGVRAGGVGTRAPGAVRGFGRPPSSGF